MNEQHSVFILLINSCLFLCAVSCAQSCSGCYLMGDFMIIARESGNKRGRKRRRVASGRFLYWPLASYTALYWPLASLTAVPYIYNSVSVCLQVHLYMHLSAGCKRSH